MTDEFLELLAREAALVEFERPVVAARTAGAPDLDDLERAKVLALRVRALLERRRRREEELSALYDTAGDLAGLRDVDAVLRAIVHRVRTLLGVDVSYLTLNDAERGDTYMRITDGSVAASFQQLRLPPAPGWVGSSRSPAHRTRPRTIRPIPGFSTPRRSTKGLLTRGWWRFSAYP